MSVKKLSILIITIVAIFITGCSAEYNVTINHKKEVKETVSFLWDNSDVKEVEDLNEKEFLKYKMDSYKNMNELRGYKFVGKVLKKNSYIKIEKHFNSLNNYQYSPFVNYAFDDVYIVDNYTGISFNANGSSIGSILFNKEDPGHDFDVEEYVYRVKAYNNILEHNADHYDEKKNVLEWYFNSDTVKKNVNFKLGDDIRYDVMILDFIYSNMVLIITLGIIFSILLIASIYFVIIYRKNNAI